MEKLIFMLFCDGDPAGDRSYHHSAFLGVYLIVLMTTCFVTGLVTAECESSQVEIGGAW